MKQITLTKAEFDKFRELQNPKKKRNDCHAAFSTNPSEDTWRFETFGLTPEQLRVEVRNQSPRLDQVFGIFIELPDKLPKGGRFFVDDQGAYWKDAEKRRHKFVESKLDEPLEQPIRQMNRPELLAQIKLKKAQKLAAGLIARDQKCEI
ncbi:MAG: hypothetical protein ABR865_16610 [Terracidiphilus sp.]|jgi:hypothetical protein